ncbi:pentapeptide repeat-containing protein [Lentzea jiangxiensis]|uniref:Uncharacterized protein YjbI, contains pentapeptide repeats n=1 Tax=Lentzea jiangxiensis TaxID=641025 RepID=A0A1H0NV63_9PSEU|nr:pentapeptide repeat-containing protein [Lentzea jiangxiensis]SDO96345.1 Uncharacterized protein YjbI, contains pentapeptide repeats [Lentzea jiangxiensis]
MRAVDGADESIPGGEPGRLRDDHLMRRSRSGTSWWRPGLTVVVPVLLSTAAAMTVLIKVLAPGTAQERLDAIRTGLAIGAGIGAVITLALALRRQQATEYDATERRLTELYVKAVDQLGSDKAAVRHGGFYALERVAQDNPAHRQTIVDVICAYLRSPYTPPRAPGSSKLKGLRAPLRPGWARPLPDTVPETTPKDADQEARQEREVRLTAQRILRDHLQPRTPARSWMRWFPRPVRTFWPDIDIDVTDATLIDFDLTNAIIRNARFDNAQFNGDASFEKAQFIGDASFEKAQFIGAASFEKAQFGAAASFSRAQFKSDAWFSKVQFNDNAWFNMTRFGSAWFAEAQFNGDALFKKAQFGATAWFDKTQFNGNASFKEASFGGIALFRDARFGGSAVFNGTRFGGIAFFNGTRFNDGAIRFDEAQFNNDVSFDRAQFKDAAFDRAQFNGETSFDNAQFNGEASFNEARFSNAVPNEVPRSQLSSGDSAPK